ncbi:hypothetical protein ACGFX2_32670 [Streptomyces goshikiensis]|uniref:hypothetical protein n=1 Tax=Streptomyces goshikiensis TaxID=1942 RepID=UPI00371A571E
MTAKATTASDLGEGLGVGTLEGQQAAAAKGNHGGRPKVIDDDSLLFARALKDRGVPVPEIAGSHAGGAAGSCRMSNGMPFGQGSLLGKELGAQKSGPGAKEKIPAYVSPETMNRLRNAVVALQRIDDEDADVPVSLSACVEAAVLAQLRRDEREYNAGSPFPQRRNKNSRAARRSRSSWRRPRGPTASGGALAVSGHGQGGDSAHVSGPPPRHSTNSPGVRSRPSAFSIPACLSSSGMSEAR